MTRSGMRSCVDRAAWAIGLFRGHKPRLLLHQCTPPHTFSHTCKSSYIPPPGKSLTPPVHAASHHSVFSPSSLSLPHTSPSHLSHLSLTLPSHRAPPHLPHHHCTHNSSPTLSLNLCPPTLSHRTTVQQRRCLFLTRTSGSTSNSRARCSSPMGTTWAPSSQRGSRSSLNRPRRSTP